jgi:hypothetical protein
VGLAAGQEIVARWCEEIDHLSVFSEPCLVLDACRNDDDVAAGGYVIDFWVSAMTSPSGWA